jgi:hypothetical protein
VTGTTLRSVLRRGLLLRRASLRLVLLASAAVGALLAPQAALAGNWGPWGFKTPGEAAYCPMEFPRRNFDAFRCITPNDGWWVRISGFADGGTPRVTKGYARSYKGFRDPQWSCSTSARYSAPATPR